MSALRDAAREELKRQLGFPVGDDVKLNGLTSGMLISFAAKVATDWQAGIQSKAETTLRNLIAWRDRMSEDEDGYPSPDPGCIECTHGVTPAKYDTGLCAWHQAESLLARIDQPTRTGQGGRS